MLCAVTNCMISELKFEVLEIGGFNLSILGTLAHFRYLNRVRHQRK